MLVIRIIAFFMMVIITCCYSTYMLSSHFMYEGLEAKNEVIDLQNKKIDDLIKQNTHQSLVIDNLKDVVREGVKTGCLKNRDSL